MTTTPQTEPISDFMERHFAHLRDGRKEYTEAEVRSIMLAFEAGLSHLVAEISDLRERNAALGNAQEIALDTATEHALRADELRGALATAEAERDQLCAQVEQMQGGEPAVRFCPGCGSVGAVPDTYKDCCPDGNHARMIPESLARRCNDLFYLALNAAQPAAPAMVPLLVESDLKWLKRFKETTEDDQSYDVPKDAIKRLAELGAVRWVGGSRYAITAFGAFVADPDDRFSGSLPLKTYADHMAASNAEHQARMNGIGQPAGGEG